MNSHIKWNTKAEISSQFLILLKNELRRKKMVQSFWYFIVQTGGADLYTN